LTQVTGIPSERIREILGFLFRQGALDERGVPEEIAGKGDQDSEMEIVRDPRELIALEIADQFTEIDLEGKATRLRAGGTAASSQPVEKEESSGLPDWLEVDTGYYREQAEAEKRMVEEQVVEEPVVEEQVVEEIEEKEPAVEEVPITGKMQVAELRLLRDVKASSAAYRKVLEALPTPEVYRQIVKKENSERVKRNARQVLRKKFQRSSAEERLDLIVATEGQCLSELPGLHLDDKTSALLRGLSYDSLLLVKNLAKFPTTPPRLIKHLLSQKTVRESIELTNLLKRHPKCPKELQKKKY